MPRFKYLFATVAFLVTISLAHAQLATPIQVGVGSSTVGTTGYEYMNFTQLAFRPDDPTHLYATRWIFNYTSGIVERYDYDPATGFLSNPVELFNGSTPTSLSNTTATTGLGATLGIAFHKTALGYDMYTTSTTTTNGVSVGGILYYKDEGQGINGVYDNPVEFVDNIPVGLHIVDMLQIIGDQLFVGIGTQTEQGQPSVESPYNGKIGTILNLNDANYSGQGADDIALTSVATNTNDGALGIWASGFRNPFGIKLDTGGNLWVTDNGEDPPGDFSGPQTPPVELTPDLIYSDIELGDRGAFPPINQPPYLPPTHPPLKDVGSDTCAVGLDFITSGPYEGDALMGLLCVENPLNLPGLTAQDAPITGHEELLINPNGNLDGSIDAYQDQSGNPLATGELGPIDICRDPYGRILIGECGPNYYAPDSPPGVYLLVVPPTLSLAASNVAGGSTITATATFGAPQPTGGTVVPLSSNTTGVSFTDLSGIPITSVTVPAGSSSAQFKVVTPTVTATTPVTISAASPAIDSLPSSGQPETVTFNLLTTPTVTGFSPTSGVVGSSVTVTGAGFTGATAVTIGGVSASAYSVTNDGQLTVTVPSGAVTGPIAVTTPGGTGTSTSSFTILPGMKSLVLSAYGGPGGAHYTGMAELLGPAPVGGAVITITSSNPSLISIPNLTIGKGGNAVSFSWSPAAVSSATKVTLTASYAGTTASPNFTITVGVASVTVNSPSGPGGVEAMGTVNLTGNAPSGGIVVTLTSSNTSVLSLPASVTVPAGSPSVNFNFTPSTVTSSTPVTITAAYDGSAQTTTYTVVPAVTYTLTPESPTGGSLSPSTLQTVGAGGTQSFTATPSTGYIFSAFTVDGNPVTTPLEDGTTVTVSGNTLMFGNVQGSHTVAATFVVTPLPTVTGFSPAGGAVSASVTITGTNFTGATSVSFGGVDASTFTVNSSGQITAVVPAGAVTGPIAVTTPTGTGTSTSSFTILPGMKSLVLSAYSGPGGAHYTGMAELLGAAPTGGAVITITSSNPSLISIPNLTIGKGGNAVSFSWSPAAVSSATKVTLTASYAGTTASPNFTITVGVASVTVNSPSGPGGLEAMGTVNLTGNAPNGGIVVTLTSSNTSVLSLPASVTVPAGSPSANFNFTPSTVATSTPVTITGSYDGSSQDTSYTVTP